MVFRRTFQIHCDYLMTYENKILHGGAATDSEALSALDSGITVLRALNVLPNEINVVHQTDVELFSERECTIPVPDAKGVILETTSPDGAMKTFRIFPTTRTHFEKGKRGGLGMEHGEGLARCLVSRHGHRRRKTSVAFFGGVHRPPPR